MIDSKDRESFRKSLAARERFVEHLESKLFKLDRHDPQTDEFHRDLKELKREIHWAEKDIQYLKDRMLSREFWAGYKS